MNKLWKISIVGILLAMGCWTWIGYDFLDSIQNLRMDNQAKEIAIQELDQRLRTDKREKEIVIQRVHQYLLQIAELQNRSVDVLINVNDRVRALDPRLSVKKGIESALIIHGHRGHGSGFFIDKAHGIILTAGHVSRHSKDELLYVRQGSVDVPILDARWDPFSDAGLIFIDPVQAQRFSASDVSLSTTPVKLGDMSISAGYPLDMNDAVYASVGVVVGLDVDDGLAVGLQCAHLIKFHLEVIPGVSGGPIFNSKGEVISINCIGMDQTQISCGPSSDQILRAIVRMKRAVKRELPDDQTEIASEPDPN